MLWIIKIKVNNQLFTFLIVHGNRPLKISIFEIFILYKLIKFLNIAPSLIYDPILMRIYYILLYYSHVITHCSPLIARVLASFHVYPTSF